MGPFVLSGLGWLIVVIGFGLTWALDWQFAWFNVTPSLLAAHVHAGLVGWLGCTLMGVSYKLMEPVSYTHLYPTRPIHVIVPFAGGSASDVVARIMLNEMSKSIGQQFVVENQPGAGGDTGTAAATKALPNGYTLVISGVGPLAANKTLFKDCLLYTSS